MNSRLTTNVLQCISNLLHPLFLLTYAMIFVCTETILCVLPTYTKLFLVGEVFFCTCLLPFLCIMVLWGMKLVSHWTLRDVNDRKLPLFINLLAYVYCTWMLYSQGMPTWLNALFLGASAVSGICWIVSFWWKISAHASGFSALTTASFFLCLNPQAMMPLWVPILLTVLTGFLGSIRIYLGRHTLSQVAAGTFLGIIVMVVFCYFLS